MRLLILLAVLSAAGYLFLSLAGDLSTRLDLYLPIHAILFLVYLAAALRLKRQAGQTGGAGLRVAIVVGAALVFRLTLLPAPPSLSDDIYRYVWEGGLQLHNINPYRYIPSDPALVDLRDPIFDGVNYKELPAIYPPVMQWAFAAGALLGRSTQAMKAVFIATDMVLILLLVRLLRVRGRESALVLLYAWNPLVVMEVAGSGHNDPLAVGFLVVAVLAIIENRQVVSMTALGLSMASKLFPVALLPLFARKVRSWLLGLPLLILAAVYLPYLSAGENLFRSTLEYAERWRHNDSIFAILVWLADGSGLSPVAMRWIDALGIDSLYAQPHMLARGAVAAMGLAALAGLALRCRAGKLSVAGGVFLFTGVALILQPTLHPWYLLWILPWLVSSQIPASTKRSNWGGTSYRRAGSNSPTEKTDVWSGTTGRDGFSGSRSRHRATLPSAPTSWVDAVGLRRRHGDVIFPRL